MIFLESLGSSTLGSGLSLEKNTLTIKNTINDFIVIDRDLEIVLEEGAYAKILDVCKDNTLCIKISNASHMLYHILNSANSRRTFECFGTLKVMQICIEESTEEFYIKLLNENASVSSEILSIASEFPMNFHQRVEHKAKHTSSNISNFGVAMHNANITFDTIGQIQKGMSKSKCVQLSKGVVMDDYSSVTSKPILLIDEYDVEANHGASIGKMSDESLFYLMSRGLSKQEAFLLILEGIIAPFMDQVTDEILKNEINLKIEKMMKR